MAFAFHFASLVLVFVLFHLTRSALRVPPRLLAVLLDAVMQARSTEVLETQLGVQVVTLEVHAPVPLRIAPHSGRGGRKLQTAAARWRLFNERMPACAFHPSSSPVIPCFTRRFPYSPYARVAPVVRSTTRTARPS